METSSRDARKRRIAERGSDRLALITGRIQTLPASSSSEASSQQLSPITSCPPRNENPPVSDSDQTSSGNSSLSISLSIYTHVCIYVHSIGCKNKNIFLSVFSSFMYGIICLLDQSFSFINHVFIFSSNSWTLDVEFPMHIAERKLWKIYLALNAE